jgi:hypothetical protein
MNAYLEDVRMKMVDAVERGMPKSEAALVSLGSEAWVAVYWAAVRRAGTVAEQKPGAAKNSEEREERWLNGQI